MKTAKMYPNKAGAFTVEITYGLGRRRDGKYYSATQRFFYRTLELANKAMTRLESKGYNKNGLAKKQSN